MFDFIWTTSNVEVLREHKSALVSVYNEIKFRYLRYNDIYMMHCYVSADLHIDFEFLFD